jgi:SAM-dependent methyltransferase
MYHDSTYLDRSPIWHLRGAAWQADVVCQLLRRHGIQPGRVAEAGCGAGEILLRLSHNLGPTVECVGFETAPLAFDTCRTKATEHLRFLHADPSTTNLRFDVLLAMDLLEHLEDYPGFLRKLRDKATYKVFHIPLDLSVQAVLRVDPLAHARAAGGRRHFFSKETALGALTDAGYEIVDCQYTSVPASGGWRSLVRKAAFRLHQDLAARVLGGYSLLVLAK